MLPKRNRASTKEVDKIFKEGKFFVSSSLTFKYFKKYNKKEVKISFIVPKNVAKLAVKRNFLRRLGYRVLEKNLHYFPIGLLGVFIFKKYQDDFFILENEIKNILSKIN
jgi:ribonuclease P protein component